MKKKQRKKKHRGIPFFLSFFFQLILLAQTHRASSLGLLCVFLNATSTYTLSMHSYFFYFFIFLARGVVADAVVVVVVVVVRRKLVVAVEAGQPGGHEVKERAGQPAQAVVVVVVDVAVSVAPPVGYSHSHPEQVVEEEWGWGGKDWRPPRRC
jgi:hypothetical protein